MISYKKGKSNKTSNFKVQIDQSQKFPSLSGTQNVTSLRFKFHSEFPVLNNIILKLYLHGMERSNFDIVLFLV